MIKSIVFFIQNFSQHAGSERVTSILANELARHGYNVTILSICGNNTCFFELDERITLYTLIKKEIVNNRKEFFAVLKKLRQFYKKHQVDLVIDVFAALSIYTIIMKKKYGFKNLTWEHFNYRVNTGMNKLGRQLAVRYSDQIVTLTNTDKEFYQEKNDIKGKIDYIYNPSPYQEVKTDKERKNIILSVGRLTYQKGFDRLIKVWQEVEDKCNWELMIIGDGEDRELLWEQIEKSGLRRVKLVGAVRNIDEYYKEATIYISTARYEGLPMTMIEAQSFGLPIVTFDYDTGPKEIVTDGSDGIIIKRDEEKIMIDSCANQLLMLMRDSKRINNYSEEAIKSAKRFKTEEIMNKWLTIIGEL